MNKGSILLGFIGAIIVLVVYSPEELIQVSINSALETGTIEVADDAEADDDATEKAEDYFQSYMSSAKFFDRAYRLVEDTEPLDEEARAGILPHHLVRPQYIAEYFEKLAETQEIDTFIVIGPNHFDRGKESIAVSQYGYTTPYGEIEPDFYIVDRLLKKGYAGWDQSAFDQEHSIGSLVPFIKKSFPDAKIVPITLKGRNLESNLDKLVEDLADWVGPNDFVLGSIDFSHYMNNYVADFHDELSQTVIETFDYDALDELEIDSVPTLHVVMKYAEEMGAKKVDIVNHSNSAEKVNGRDFVAETTSHFYIAFEEGDIEADRAVTVMAVGDIMMGRYVRTLSERADDLEYPFGLIRGQEDRFFYGADVFFGNLEGPIEGDGHLSGTSVIFGFKEEIAPLMARMGFDVLSIANNHILNQGGDGFDSTLELLKENGIGACGHPTEASPYSVVYREFGGKTVAFMCFDDIAHRLDTDAAFELVETVSENVDFAIVSIHWGFEYKHEPNNYRQVVPARRFVDAGADAVIGHHPHVVQSMEVYEGVPIFYSLGNFIFDQYWSYDTQEQLGVGLVLGEDTTKVYLFPMYSEHSQPYLLEHKDRERFYDRFLDWEDYDEEMEAMIRSGVVEIWR